MFSERHGQNVMSLRHAFASLFCGILLASCIRSTHTYQTYGHSAQPWPPPHISLYFCDFEKEGEPCMCLSGGVPHTPTKRGAVRGVGGLTSGPSFPTLPTLGELPGGISGAVICTAMGGATAPIPPLAWCVRVFWCRSVCARVCACPALRQMHVFLLHHTLASCCSADGGSCSAVHATVAYSNGASQIADIIYLSQTQSCQCAVSCIAENSLTRLGPSSSTIKRATQ